MLLGQKSGPIRVSFFLEAKLYSTTNAVGVEENSRLYDHPVVMILGPDIAGILSENGIATAPRCAEWIAQILDQWQ
jgi:hypothetical protein